MKLMIQIILIVFVFLLNSYAQTQDNKPRVIVLTDIGEDPDDQQSLVRFLLYSCDFDVEGIVATTTEWMRGNDEFHPVNPAPEYIHEILDAYARVEDNLRLHSTRNRPAGNYPTATNLRKVVFAGNIDHGNNQEYGMDDVGEGKSSPGSEHIVNMLKKDDDRNLWILIWGGANTLAQSVFDIMNSELDAGTKDILLSKIRAYDIAGQDDAGGWIAHHYPTIFYMRSVYQYRGMAYKSCYESSKEYLSYDSETCPPGQYCCKIGDEQGGNADIFTPGWIQENIKKEGHPLGDVYPKRGSAWSEGQSPTFLYFVNTALSFPDSIAWGGWGGRFKRTKDCGSKASVDEDFILPFDFEQNYCMYVPARDWAYTPRVEKFTWNRLAPVFRWREDMTWDFKARMDWAVNHVDSTNHHPVIKLENHRSNEPLLLNVYKGDTIRIAASESYDPDGNGLHFKWWIYEEPGLYKGRYKPEEMINQQNTSNVNIYVPDDAGPGESIHLILELTDDGEPILKDYQRIVFQIASG